MACDMHGSFTERPEDGATTGSATDSATNDERATLAKTETKLVAGMEFVLFLVLFAVSLLVSTAVYSYSISSQEEAFRNSFEADATKLLEAFYRTVESELGAVDSLSVQITSHAESTGATFPYVTLPNFGVRSANIRALSGSFMVGYYPLVTDENRLEWEQYAIDNNNHFDDALSLEIKLRKRQDVQFNFSDTGELNNMREPSDEILTLASSGFLERAETNSGPFLPVWQLSPVTDKSLLNFNALSHPSFAGAYLETVKTGQAVIDVTTSVAAENLRGTGIFYSKLLALSQYRKDAESFRGDPTSAFSYPVFDSFDIDDRKVVGVIGTNMYWRLIFKNVLPKNTRGIICVLENSRNQTFTYRIDDTVAFVGHGDHHDTKYDAFETATDLATARAEQTTLETKSFTSSDLNTIFCNYKLRVYPTQETEAQHVNRDPVRAMMVIVAVFLLTSIVFVVYACTVRRRQRIVMDRALASGAIVSSLFPSQVRDQIYRENKAEKDKSWFPHLGGDKEVMGHGVGVRPIATLFENTSVLFADLVGFTQWCSSRDPADIFDLLETLYQAFDIIAVRRNVFKVETIGDCYVAVTGLPNPQDDHAVIMVKFADACLVQMNDLKPALARKLGPDTAQLAIRVGIHSGSVTGGVLRGQKSRYQLFGDTMNTAARMESNGRPGCIHVSETTANELVAKGKSSWIQARDDKIVAKGKGEMQTYWVSVGTRQSVVENRLTIETSSSDEESKVTTRVEL